MIKTTVTQTGMQAETTPGTGKVDNGEELPTETGWYSVEWENVSGASYVYLTVLHDGIVLWGWHENDDPEVINEPFKWRKANEQEVADWKAGNDLDF